MAKPSKSNKTPSAKAKERETDIVVAPAMTRHLCACGCGKFSSVKDLRPIKSIGGGHAHMIYYISGHEAHPRKA